jgi:hypothetical protein
VSRRSNLFGVGIVSATLPAWADYTALPNGQFIEFTLNTPNATGVVMQQATLYDWCGGVFVPDFGARGGVVYAGGGEHSGWTDSSPSGGQNGAYVLDCDTRLYSRKCFPTATHSGMLSDGVGSPTDNWGAYNDDGAPQAKHTYNCMSYMPAAWGGGASGSAVRVAHTGGISYSRGYYPNIGYSPGASATWRYDLSKTAHTLADPSIIKLTGAGLYDFGKVPNTDTLGFEGATINDRPIACIDTIRQGWWATNKPGTGWGSDMVFTSKTGVISAPYANSGNLSPLAESAALHHFADDDIVVGIIDDSGSDSNGPHWRWVVKVWQAGTSTAWQTAPVNRQTISLTERHNSYPTWGTAYPRIGEVQPRWSSILGCFVGLDNWYPMLGAAPTSTTTMRLWKITPPPAGQRLSGTWQITWELVTAKAGTEATNFFAQASDAGSFNGVFGRLVECPSLRAFVWTRNVNQPGQLIRLQGM